MLIGAVAVVRPMIRSPTVVEPQMALAQLCTASVANRTPVEGAGRESVARALRVDVVAPAAAVAFEASSPAVRPATHRPVGPAILQLLVVETLGKLLLLAVVGDRPAVGWPSLAEVHCAGQRARHCHWQRRLAAVVSARFGVCQPILLCCASRSSASKTVVVQPPLKI